MGVGNAPVIEERRANPVKTKARIGIRETALTPEVTDELLRMSEDWEKENSCHGYRKNAETDIAGKRIFTACSGAQIIGYLLGHGEKTDKPSSMIPQGETVFEVDELYVCPAFRGQGVGAQLFQYAEQAVLDEASFLTLTAASRNGKAILHFYLEEMGMTFWSARLFKPLHALPSACGGETAASPDET
ncbi:MAG: GNAT family N-acetyltransferase [Clostridia bacterium]|nr:GNAT family N-acetyltransferase [Clostridia bacterium]